MAIGYLKQILFLDTIFNDEKKKISNASLLTTIFVFSTFEPK